MKQQQKQPIISVEEFFYDDHNTPWKPLPEHDLKQSPCYPIIIDIYADKREQIQALPLAKESTCC